MTSKLYTKTLYLNKDIDYLFQNEIIEYDVKEAGYNIIKYYKLLSDDKIRLLDSYPTKEQRHIKIGLYQREDKEFANTLSEKFSDVRRMFFEVNNIEDSDIVSIKKDAIFIKNKYCSKCKFDNIDFRVKNRYTSYLYLDNNEFYFDKNKVDVKGLNDDVVLKHKDYMLDFLHTFVKLVENGNNKITINRFKQFIDYYRNRELDINYYRELNKRSMFRIFDNNISEGFYYSDNESSFDDDRVDIMYNYVKYITPLISIVL